MQVEMSLSIPAQVINYPKLASPFLAYPQTRSEFLQYSSSVFLARQTTQSQHRSTPKCEFVCSAFLSFPSTFGINKLITTGSLAKLSHNATDERLTESFSLGKIVSS